MKNLAALGVLLYSCFLLPMTSCHQPGQKLLKVEITQEGEVVLLTLFDVDDSCTVSEIWDACGERPFATEIAADSLDQGEPRSLETRLTGPVEIRIIHASGIQTSATLTDLTLVRTTLSDNDWRLPPAEIGRAKEAAGL